MEISAIQNKERNGSGSQEVTQSLKKKKLEWLTFPLELQLLLGAANPNAPTTVFFTLMNTEAFTAKGWMGGAKRFSEFL